MNVLQVVGLVIFAIIAIFLLWIFFRLRKTYGWKIALATIILAPLGLLTFSLKNFAERRHEKEVVILKATELYEGNRKAALEWLKRSNPALGNITPNQAIRRGRVVLVLHLINRLKYGIYS